MLRLRRGIFLIVRGCLRDQLLTAFVESFDHFRLEILQKGRFLLLIALKQFALFELLLEHVHEVHLQDGVCRRKALFLRRKARKRAFIEDVLDLLRAEHLENLPARKLCLERVLLVDELIDHSVRALFGFELGVSP